MKLIQQIKQKAKKDIKTIILPESFDIRVLHAASIVKYEGFANIILIGNNHDIMSLAHENNIDLSGIEIIDPCYDKRFDEIKERFYLLRKEKGMTLEEADKILKENYLYYGCMLVKLGYADGQVSGAIHSSADTIRPALQILKTEKNVEVASSFFLMDVPNCTYGENGVFIFSDCGLIQNPYSNELASIAASSALSYRKLVGDNPKIAFLSHSTFGTSKCNDVDKVVNAVKIFGEKYKDLNVEYDGELQFDAAIVPEVAKLKAPASSVAGYANVLIFPDLDAGNIGYKIAQRLGNAEAYGPIIQGLTKPVNDLSRGCSVEDIVGVVAITAVQAQ